MPQGDIQLSSNFELQSQRPLDAKIRALTLLERDARPLVSRYWGMEIFVEETWKAYRLIDPLKVNLMDNSKWKESVPSGYAAEVSAANVKSTPVDADTVGIVDSANSNIIKKLSWAGIKATLKAYFDTLYNLYSHPNHFGDVSSLGDGTTTIASNVVTNSKLFQMAVNTIKGRVTASTGAPEDLTAANVRTIINVANGADVTASSIAPAVHAAALKSTPVDADEIFIVDSVSSWAIKKLTWANIKSNLGSYFNSIYAPVLGVDDNYVTNAEKGAWNGKIDKATANTITAIHTFSNGARFNGFVGVGANPLHLIDAYQTPLAVVANATNHRYGGHLYISSDYDVAVGVTDSGSRRGLLLDCAVGNANFKGVLGSQVGLKIDYGHYGSAGSGTITNSYGLYLDYLSTGNTTIINKYGIYQRGAVINYFEGNMGVGATDPATALDVNGVITTRSATASEIAGFNSAKGLISLPVATYPSLAQLAYVKGVTSAIQTQLNNKQELQPYTALTSGSSVVFSLLTGLNKTLSVEVNTTISFSNPVSGMQGDIRLNVTSVSSITLTGTGITFYKAGKFTNLPVGVYHISYTVISLSIIDCNINSTLYV